MNPRLFDRTEQNKAKITLRMNFVGGSIFNRYMIILIAEYESLQKDYSRHTTLNTMEIKFSGMIENRSHNEKFYDFETFLSFLNENNLIKYEFCKKTYLCVEVQTSSDSKTIATKWVTVR